MTLGSIPIAINRALLESPLLALRGGARESLHSTAMKTNPLGFLTEFFEQSANVINATGGLVLVFASMMAILNTLHLTVNTARGRKSGANKLLIGSQESSIAGIRLHLGTMVIFSLELLVAADVIDTLTKSVHEYRLETLYKITIVVAVRTVLSYFLGKELEELEHKLTLQDKKKEHAH